MAKLTVSPKTGKKVYGKVAQNIRKLITKETTGATVVSAGLGKKSLRFPAKSGVGTRLRRTMGGGSYSKKVARDVAKKSAAVAPKGKAPSWLAQKLNVSDSALGKAGIGIAVAMVLNQLANTGIQEYQTRATQKMQMGQMDQMAAMSGEDQYYAAALPEMRGQRQMAQQALMQTILGGQGIPMQAMQVPGEKRIGGY